MFPVAATCARAAGAKPTAASRTSARTRCAVLISVLLLRLVSVWPDPPPAGGGRRPLGCPADGPRAWRGAPGGGGGGGRERGPPPTCRPPPGWGAPPPRVGPRPAVPSPVGRCRVRVP